MLNEVMRQKSAGSVPEHMVASDRDERQEIAVLVGLVVLKLKVAAEGHVALELGVLSSRFIWSRQLLAEAEVDKRELHLAFARLARTNVVRLEVAVAVAQLVQRLERHCYLADHF
jgi:hypothetical protein